MSQAKILNKEPGFSTEQWMVWLLSFITITGGCIVFIYANFETRVTADENKQSQSRIDEVILKRLDRMEDKLDQLLTNSKK